MTPTICDACETVAYCSKHGCIPAVIVERQSAPRPLNFEQWFRRERLAGRLASSEEQTARLAWHAALSNNTPKEIAT